jgi:hypothetical protein
MKRNDLAGSVIGVAILVAMVAVFLGGLVMYLRQGSVAGSETVSEVGDTDFSQLDSTISGL